MSGGARLVVRVVADAVVRVPLVVAGPVMGAPCVSVTCPVVPHVVTLRLPVVCPLLVPVHLPDPLHAPVLAMRLAVMPVMVRVLRPVMPLAADHLPAVMLDVPSVTDVPHVAAAPHPSPTCDIGASRS